MLFLLRAALRLEADIPAGVLRVDPDPAFEHWFPLRIENLRLVGHPLHVQVDASGTAMIETNAPVRLHGDGVEKRLPR